MDRKDFEILESEIEVLSGSELSVLEHFKPQEVNTYIQEPDSNDEESKLAQGIDKTISDLAGSLDIESPETDPEKVLDNISSVTVDNQKAFDLLASKTLKTLNTRARFKAVMAANILQSKMADMISKVDQYDYQADPMNFILLTEKYLEYIEKLDRLQENYNESVEESLQQLSQENKEKSYKTEEKLTPSQFADIAKKIQEMTKSDNK